VQLSPKLPKKLNKAPLFEAIFELRFEASGPSGDLLLGLLYAGMRDKYPRVEALPIANVPHEIRQKEATLRYQASHRLLGENALVQVGDRTVSLASVEKYMGWAPFKNEAIRLLEMLHGTGLVGRAERFSFRYRNLLPQAGDGRLLDLLNARFDVLGRPVDEPGFQLRFEVREPEATTITQIHSGVTVTTHSGARTGLLLDLDTVWTAAADFWTAKTELLEHAHRTVKEAFFRMLTPEAIQSLEPEWE
jgi:uncharacterized protein (TIGR04255 family)